MVEYIERQALQQDIHLRYCKDCNNHNEVKCKACWVDDMLDEITEAPTADVVEVVRCKDCKHWNCVSRVTEHMGCNIFYGAYGREYPTNPDDFCSYGEKEERF